MKTLIYAIGIAMFFEGVPYLTMPRQAKKAAFTMSQMSDNVLRVLGGALVLVGFVLLYYI